MRASGSAPAACSGARCSSPSNVVASPGLLAATAAPIPKSIRQTRSSSADDHVVEVEREVEHAAIVCLGERAEGGDPDPNGL